MVTSIELPAKFSNAHPALDVDEEDGGGAELAGLLSRSRFGVAPQHALHRRRRSEHGGEDGANATSCLQLLVSFVFFVGVVGYAVNSFSGTNNASARGSNYRPPFGHDPASSAHDTVAAASGLALVAGDSSSYQCRTGGKRSSSNIHQLSARHNITLPQLKKGKLEGWGISYTKLKKILSPWKEEVFVPNVESGDLIFESACGAGVNLLLTAEILQENAIRNIQVFGNDYSPDAVGAADLSWSSEEAHELANKGRFCQGDSSRLADFVPASSFDLAYTGYLVPLIPHFPDTETEEESWMYSVSLCNSTDPSDVRLRDREQRTQEEWISTWVKGLLHIVKPGKVVALENVAYPLCSAEGGRDWGGVSKGWWGGAVRKYGWEADPDSLLIRDEGKVKGWDENRYHVMMRKIKKGAHATTGGEASSPEIDPICPHVEKSMNDQAVDEFDWYVKDANAHKGKTLLEFQTMTLDGWGISLREVKDLLRPWKEKVFVKNIESGDSIYESAMGIGMNLVISAEILKEHNIDGLTVSGNDYVAESVAIANNVWDETKDLEQMAHKGFFCRADSSNLDFIPDSTFDFVYTGYIDPIVDPLQLWPTLKTVEEKWAKDIELCKSDDEESQRLAKKAQSLQNEWFASWVGHLIRIAKPGKVVAIENGAESLCTNPKDWGGVDKSWWKGAINTYKWDVDPDSLFFEDEVPTENWKDKRYHVMMRKIKKGAHATTGGEASSPEIDPICPHVEKSMNDQAVDEFDWYVKDANAHKGKTLLEFQTMTLDGWGISLREVKDLLRPWKEKVFVKNIESGDSIYESAMGIGMNLVISAEILKEHNIDGLTVSGNDYVAESVAIANNVWDETKDLEQMAHKGFFCRADSSNLDFIPDSTFDFVYTGYIDPIVDPLQLWPTLKTVEEKWAKDIELCKSDDEESQRLAKKAQSLQNEWFASWVGHLIRIAKPGKVVAIENGAESLCTNPKDWGGVDKSWWKGAINTYKWDVDPDSLFFEDEVPTENWKDKRYHVMMRKI